ncbi:MAG TPA: hypothetical protein VK034_00725 [Enhygromyxa sp.]|nr:hypothetical protein [Enhygromyxa sp.]
MAKLSHRNVVAVQDVGTVFLGLGLAIRKGSEIALWAAIVIFVIDSLLGLFWVLESDGRPSIGGIFVRVFLIVAMAKASGAKKRAAALNP